MTVVAELDSLPERIKVSSGRITELREQLAAELETRERLIVQAVDEANIPQADVARAAGVSQPHIIRILAKASSD
ncbi:sigma factor-like helix-turn-helix DNA-binding protein [Nocardioides soli]|uniref:DNA-directed RNA polymerase specialized sigma subunit n=1 Tax=Nocardioides soli TaxID=1036020 RepID=A0A7W4Z3J7_9ACTN|nr:hypothetical protein [Nocardioides soli]MBB3043936.1 DNA-directed RNA polymerase specialized sigma subunit [Nocardioides soli]